MYHTNVLASLGFFR